MAFVMVGGASVMTYIGESFYRLRNEIQFTAAARKYSVKKVFLKISQN